MEGQTAARQGQVRGWLLLPETRRFGRRSRPPEREEEAERLPCGLPAHEEPGEEGSTSGEEEEERALPLPKDLDTARLDEMREDRCTCATTSPRISSLKRVFYDPGVTVRALR